MILYISTIVLAMAGIFSYNYFTGLSGFSPLINALLTLSLPFLLVAWDGLGAFIVHWVIPGKYFSADSNFVGVSNKECKIYELLGIKIWKDHVLELGFLGNFSKKKIDNPKDPEYIKLFIQECNVGSVVHLVNVVQGFLLLFFFPYSYKHYYLLAAVFVNTFLSILPVMVLRYNIPRLRRLLVILEKKAERQAKKND